MLERLEKQYMKTRGELEKEGNGVKRWDYSPAILFAKPRYMKNILDDIFKACKYLQEFFTILGNDLKAITGSGQAIDHVKEEVIDYISKLEGFHYDVFNEEYSDPWKTQFEAFE